MLALAVGLGSAALVACAWLGHRTIVRIVEAQERATADAAARAAEERVMREERLSHVEAEVERLQAKTNRLVARGGG